MKVLTKNDVFCCSVNPAVQFRAIQPDEIIKKMTSSNSGVLTDKAILRMSQPGQCPKLLSPAGVPLPCPYAVLPVNWAKASERLTINGGSVLVKGSYVTCPQDGKIKVTIPKENNIEIQSHSISMGMPSGVSVGSVSIAATINASPTVPSAAVERPENKKLDKPSESKVPVKKKEPSEKLPRQTEKTSEQQQTITTIVAVESNQKSREIPNYQYALCDYKNCPEWKTCKYLKAPDSADSIKNSAATLGKNYKEQYPEQYAAYEEETKRKNAESGEGNWSIAKHHIISGKQIFAAHPYLVKLANYYGYDINCAENCILLPTTHSFEGKEGLCKQANGYVAMSYMKQQWHVGGHSYTMDRETILNIDQYLEKTSVNNIVFYKNYVEAVEHEINILEAKYKKPFCRKKDYVSKQKRFIDGMNQISARVGQKLLDFRSSPKKSFPYYVSKEAVHYAFDVPNRKKFIIIYQKQRKRTQSKALTAVKMVVTRYRKDDNRIFFANDAEYEITDAVGFVKFSENVRYFVCLTETYVIPWKINFSRESVLQDKFTQNSIEDYCKEHEQKLISFIEGRENGEMYYEPIVKMIKERLREL